MNQTVTDILITGFYLNNEDSAAESYSSCTVCQAGKACNEAGMSVGIDCPLVRT
jgi:hypothetical protein